MDSLNMIHLISMELIINCQTNIKKTGLTSLGFRGILEILSIIKAELPVSIIQQLLYTTMKHP